LSKQAILDRLEAEVEVRVAEIDDQASLRALIESGAISTSATGTWCGIAPTPEEEARLDALRADVVAAADDLAMEVTLEQIQTLPETLTVGKRRSVKL